MKKENKKIVFFFSIATLGLVFLLSKKKSMEWIKPVADIITSPFGQRGAEFHNGVDIRAKEGTPIRATRSGVVMNVYKSERGGLQMIVEHDNKYRTGYAHLSKAILSQGAHFSQGDILALSGNTGKTTGAHLHLTLRDPQGALVDPQSLIYKA